MDYTVHNPGQHFATATIRLSIREMRVARMAVALRLTAQKEAADRGDILGMDIPWLECLAKTLTEALRTADGEG